MNKMVLTAVACFAAGTLAGLYWPRERVPVPLESKLTSEGRKIIRNLEKQLDSLNYADILADQTRVMQALAEQEPAVEQAEFHAAALNEKTAALQAAATRETIHALARMPLSDRETYRAYLLKNNDALRRQTLLLPLLIDADLSDTSERPRDKIFRKIRYISP